MSKMLSFCLAPQEVPHSMQEQRSQTSLCFAGVCHERDPADRCLTTCNWGKGLVYWQRALPADTQGLSGTLALGHRCTKQADKHQVPEDIYIDLSVEQNGGWGNPSAIKASFQRY